MSPTLRIIVEVPLGHISCASMSSSRLLVVALFFLVGLSPLHEIAVSYSSQVVHWAAQKKRFYSNIFPQLPIFKCFSSFTLSLSASLFLPFCYYSLLYFILSCTRQTPSKTAVYIFGLLLTPSIFCRLHYPILFQLAILLISPIQPTLSAMYGWQPLAYSLFNIGISTFSRPSVSVKWVRIFLVLLLVLLLLLL